MSDGSADLPLLSGCGCCSVGSFGAYWSCGIVASRAVRLVTSSGWLPTRGRSIRASG
jgi:hypothetical protein